MQDDENHKPYSVETRSQFVRGKGKLRIPDGPITPEAEQTARYKTLGVVSGRGRAVDELFHLVPRLRKLNISGLRTRLERGRPLTPTQFYRYVNRY